MGRYIKKKTWPKFFELMRTGKKNAELRLNDFDVSPGDVILFREWNPDIGEYTGRTVTRTVINVNHVNPFSFWPSGAISKRGLLLIECKKMSRD